MADEIENRRVYDVVVNVEEQYSIWPIGLDLPVGWNRVGKSGAKEECLKHVRAVWTDMRPLSMRRAAKKSS